LVLVTGPDGPIAGARVCVWEDAGSGWVGTTDGSGRLEFAALDLAAGVLSMTATAPDHLPAERTLPVVESSAPLLVQVSCQVSDDGGETWGNGDGEINPGETIELRPVLRNLGGGVATDATATLACDDPRVVIQSGTTTWDDLASQDAAPARDALRVSIDPDDASGWCAVLALTIAADGMPTREETLSFEIVRADPTVTGCRIFESNGDIDGVLEAGETAGLLLDLRNDGTGTLPEAQVTLTSNDPYVQVSEPRAHLRQPIPPDGSESLGGIPMIEIRPDCPRPWYLAGLELVIDDGFESWTVSVLISVGTSGFTDDMEAGEGAWRTTDHRGRWSLSSGRAHSGGTSWTCVEPDGRYRDDADMELLSPPIVVPPEATLRFWRYLDVPTYGTDGLYVEVVSAGERKVLDFLGSGGALNDALFVSGWAEVEYPLDPDPGGIVRVAFRFVSDGADGGEGVYIDDVQVTGRDLVERDVRAVSAVPLAAPWPNPFATTLLLQVDLPQVSRARLVIYDVAGRRVRTLVDGTLSAGRHPILWDGRDDTGRQTAAGRYFVRLEGVGTWQRPVVRLR
jgi:hypothetical protein